ncbi:LysR family transcriptional regulator [Agarivorans albus]|uniref:Transcriptional regulator n=1 Tax=Agarivorans albus MKT 106 TaxID=1331007 RepID=R9PJ01_AGAAL|nr:LysR family transcriptional regulator [Agarivorans albus]GAD01339.1 transcriptional regulator [Agarivorans albus MKT 106]
MDKHECIKLFVRTANLGSFTAAASEFGMTQGAVSKKIAWLEAKVEFKLFHRSSRTVNLTQQGYDYLEYCEQLIEEFALVEARIKGELSEVKGLLKLSVPSALATQLLVKPINDFMNMHPEITFNVSVNDQQVDLIEGDIDIALRASVLESSGYKARHLFDNRAIYTASPQYLNSHGIPTKAEELTTHRCLVYTLSARSHVWGLSDRQGKTYSVPVKRAFSSDSPELLMQMALSGQGITLLPDWMGRKHIEGGRLVQVLDSYKSMSLPMYAVFKSDDYQPYRVRAFIDFLVEYFNSL